MLSSRHILPVVVASIFISPLHAADYYMNLSGAGSEDGSSWANALPSAGIGTFVDTTMQPGDTLYLEGDDYGDLRIVIDSSGTAGAYKAIIGVDRGGGLPYFEGIQSTRSYTTIVFYPNASYWRVENMEIRRREIGVRADGGNHGLILSNITVRNVRDAGFKFSDVDGLTITNCRAEQYNERGFYFVHSNTDVMLENCVADCTGSGLVDDPSWQAVAASPVGFDFHIKGSELPANTNVTLEDCEALNNDEDTATQGDWEQGDGFKLEGSNDSFTFRRCVAHRNQDAGFDLKGTNVDFADCFALNNLRYGFKFWKTNTIDNCIAVNNGSDQLILAGSSATLTVNHGTFHGLDGMQRGVRVEFGSGTAVLNDSIISFGGSPGSYTSGAGAVTTNNTVTHAYASNTVNAPRYYNPVIPWDGVGNNYDSQTYGLSNGYNSMRVGGAASFGVNVANGSANELLAGDVVGVVPAGNWSNSTSNNETLANVVGSGGSATTADVSFINTAFGYVNDTGSLALPMADDAKMMRSMRAKSNSPVVCATVAQVPYAAYDVYVYWGGRTSSQSVPVMMSVELQYDTTGGWVTQQTKYMRDDDRTWDGTYNESAATSSGAATDGNEYVVFRNVSETTFRIRSTCADRTGFAGFQVVEAE